MFCPNLSSCIILCIDKSVSAFSLPRIIPPTCAWGVCVSVGNRPTLQTRETFCLKLTKRAGVQPQAMYGIARWAWQKSFICHTVLKPDAIFWQPFWSYLNIWLRKTKSIYSHYIILNSSSYIVVDDWMRHKISVILILRKLEVNDL
jgi:hypothetical protein